MEEKWRGHPLLGCFRDSCRTPLMWAVFDRTVALVQPCACDDVSSELAHVTKRRLERSSDDSVTRSHDGIVCQHAGHSQRISCTALGRMQQPDGHEV